MVINGREGLPVGLLDPVGCSVWILAFNLTQSSIISSGGMRMIALDVLGIGQSSRKTASSYVLGNHTVSWPGLKVRVVNPL